MAIALMNRLLRGWLAASRRARDAEVLRSMTDRELADLGIGRGEVPGLLHEQPAQPGGATARSSTVGSHVVVAR